MMMPPQSPANQVALDGIGLQPGARNRDFMHHDPMSGIAPNVGRNIGKLCLDSTDGNLVAMLIRNSPGSGFF